MNIVLTRHAKKRVTERHLSIRTVVNAAKAGILIDQDKIKHGDLVMVYRKDRPGCMLIITVYKISSVLKTEYEKHTWIRLFDLIQNDNTPEFRNNFLQIHAQYKESTEKTAPFEQLLLNDTVFLTDNTDHDREQRKYHAWNTKNFSLQAYALVCGNLEAVDLLTFGYNIGLTDGEVYSPLHTAFRKVSSVRDLREPMPYEEINQKSSGIIKCINYLYEKIGQSGYFSHLIRHRCDNYSLLHRALFYGHDNLACCLIRYNADVTEKDLTKYNESPLQLAGSTNELMKSKFGIEYVPEALNMIKNILE